MAKRSNSGGSTLRGRKPGGRAPKPARTGSKPSRVASQSRRTTSKPGGGPAVVTRVLGTPVFSQPQPTADPSVFKIIHPSDADAYKAIDELNKEGRLQAMPFPTPRGSGAEPVLELADVFGANSSAVTAITNRGQIVFHATGDCGSTRGPKTQNEVTDKMIGDFAESDPKEIPQFALLLGDVVYNFGEAEYYYDQFYEPYRNYHAPVLAVAGNHDGMVSPLAHATSLAAYLRNFCADPSAGFTVTPEAGGLSRTAQIQPGVFFTFDAPFVRFLLFYSNTLEDPGVIANSTIGEAQLVYLRAALQRAKDEKYSGALIFAHHHPQYAIGGQHSSSVEMRQQMDEVCKAVGVWPHAVLSGHAHSYQRFTRLRSDGTEIPYVTCGNGGHNVQKLSAPGGVALRTPQTLQKKTAQDDEVTFENYDDVNFGYLRVIVNAQQLRIEYHPASDGVGVKTPDDSVTIDLATRKRTTFVPSDLGYPMRAQAVTAAYTMQATARALKAPPVNAAPVRKRPQR
jgi:hypothetical protein